MNKFLRIIFSFILFWLAIFSTPQEAVGAAFLTPNTKSFDYIIQVKGEVSLVQGEENYYVVTQNNTNSEITNSNKNDDSSLIFGKDAITEDNILKHYIFNKSNVHKNRAFNKISPMLKGTIHTRAP